MENLLLKSKKELKISYTDVLIAGCGVAGLYAALNLNPDIGCIMLNKAGIKKSNSVYAQGGIAAVLSPGAEGDSIESHFKDTVKAGSGICDENAVRVLVEEAKSNIKKTMEFNVRYDKDKNGFLLTKEGGHSKRRILHCGGDATGYHMTKKLYESVIERKNIEIKDDVFLCDILTSKNKAYAVTYINEKDEPGIIYASRIIIATGGLGRVYRNTTNAVCITGDGIAAAKRAGARLSDMEFIQFHPTALIHPSETGRFFLISEALRGEGGILRNRKWEPFMKDVHPSGDLAPRDIVSQAIIKEMKKNDIPNVYLDITHKPRKFLQKRFPTIYNECMSRGIDIAKNWIPVVPVQHYSMGGIKTDINARTSIKNLYACGEASCTGVHGANRLASNSLLECLVFSAQCAMDINKDFVKDVLKNNESRHTRETTEKKSRFTDMDYDSFASEIRYLTTLKCGIIRKKTELKDAHKRITEIQHELKRSTFETKKSIETYNMALVALEITAAASKREESVGAHFIV